MRSVVLTTLELYVGIVDALADEADREDGDDGETMHLTTPAGFQHAGGGRASLCPLLDPRGSSWSCQDPFTDDSITGVEAAALEADLVGTRPRGRDAADGGRRRGTAARSAAPKGRAWPRPRSPPVRR